MRKKKFEFSKIGEFDMGLALQFDTTEDSVFISQPSSVEFIKNEFQVSDITKPAPITKWYEKRREDEPKFTATEVTQYLSLLGSLSHLGRMTRPDIILAVFHLASFCADPCERHYDALKHIVQYLVGTKDKGIYLLCEAEYCTFTDCAKDILWAKGLAKFFKCPFPEPAELRCDNVTAKHMAEGKAKLNRTKHIDALRKHIGVKYHFIRELVDFNVLSLTYVDTTQNESDILTKPLARTKFHSAATKLLNESARACRLTIAQHTTLGSVGDMYITITRSSPLGT